MDAAHGQAQRNKYHNRWYQVRKQGPTNEASESSLVQSLSSTLPNHTTNSGARALKNLLSALTSQGGGMKPLFGTF